MIYKNNSRQGSILIITMLVLIMIATFGAGIMMTTTYHYKTTRTLKALSISQYCAKSGLNLLVVGLNKRVNITRMEGQIGNYKSIIYQVDGAGDWKDLANDAIINDASAPLYPEAYAILQAKDNPLLERGNRHFRVEVQTNGSTAFQANSSASYDNKGYSVMGYVNRDSSSYTLPGVTGYNSIYVKAGAVVDSYDSTHGAYGTTVTVDGETKQNMYENGALGSNGDITLVPKSSITNDPSKYLIYGNVVPGVDGTIIGQSGPGDTSAVAPGKETESRPTPLPMPSELDITWLGESTQGTLNVKPSDTHTITESGHYDEIDFRGDLVIDGNVTIYCHGDFTANGTGSMMTITPGSKLTLYIHGKLKYNGNFQMDDADPQNFKVKLTNDQRNLEVTDDLATTDVVKGYHTISGNSTFYGVIDAPWSNVQVIGNADMYGAVIGYNVLLGGSDGTGPEPHQAKIHYDENLGNIQNEDYYYFLHTMTKGRFADKPGTSF